MKESKNQCKHPSFAAVNITLDMPVVYNVDCSEDDEYRNQGCVYSTVTVEYI